MCVCVCSKRRILKSSKMAKSFLPSPYVSLLYSATASPVHWIWLFNF